MGENGVSLPHWYYSMRPHLRTHTLETDDSGDADVHKIIREFSSSKETISSSVFSFYTDHVQVSISRDSKIASIFCFCHDHFHMWPCIEHKRWSCHSSLIYWYTLSSTCTIPWNSYVDICLQTVWMFSETESDMMIHDFAMYLSVELYISALKGTITVTPEKTDFVHARSDCTG